MYMCIYTLHLSTSLYQESWRKVFVVYSILTENRKGSLGTDENNQMDQNDGIAKKGAAAYDGLSFVRDNETSGRKRPARPVFILAP